ncbi:MAG: hypothetical protein IRZ33_05710 [Alicyclobacillaceae bacterium]|nr:hypothetical protein [Alicyclobacillaceae bacterium]
MQVWVDGCRVESAGSVEQVLDDVYRRNRFVRRVVLNGVERSIEEVAGLSPDDTWELQVDTCTLDELIEDTMASVVEMIPPLYKRLQEAADAFRVGNIAEGAVHFAESVPLLQWNHTVLNQLTRLQPGAGSFVHEVSAEGERVVSSLMEAWNLEDYILIADILEYELLPWLVKWKAGSDLFQSLMKLEHTKKSVGGHELQ